MLNNVFFALVDALISFAFSCVFWNGNKYKEFPTYWHAKGIVIFMITALVITAAMIEMRLLRSTNY